MKKFGATLALLRRHPPPSAASLVSPLCALTHCPQALRSPLSHAAWHVASSGLARRVGALPIPARPPSIPRTACFSSRARGGVAIATGAAVVLPIHSDGTALRVLLKLPPACAQPSHTITLQCSALCSDRRCFPGVQIIRMEQADDIPQSAAAVPASTAVVPYPDPTSDEEEEAVADGIDKGGVAPCSPAGAARGAVCKVAHLPAGAWLRPWMYGVDCGCMMCEGMWSDASVYQQLFTQGIVRQAGCYWGVTAPKQQSRVLPREVFPEGETAWPRWPPGS